MVRPRQVSRSALACHRLVPTYLGMYMATLHHSEQLHSTTTTYPHFYLHFLGASRTPSAIPGGRSSHKSAQAPRRTRSPRPLRSRVLPFLPLASPTEPLADAHARRIRLNSILCSPKSAPVPLSHNTTACSHKTAGHSADTPVRLHQNLDRTSHF